MPAARTLVAALFTLLACVRAVAETGPTATGRNGAVAAEHLLASRAGVEILQSGGNAVDAAVAAGLATGVVNPSSSGLGGGGFLVVYLGDESRVHTVDFRETAPRASERDMYVRDGTVDANASLRGGLAVGVPGEVAGFALALERFGTKTFAEVAAPAIRLAREGFPVEPHLAEMIDRFRDRLAADTELAATFLHADGSPLKEGERLSRPRLADTLERLATEGPKSFYEGELAGAIVAAVRAGGGIMSAEDLSGYRPQQRPPVIVSYRKWQILGMPPPSSGGGVIGETLNVLAPYRPRDLGHNSSTYLHVLAEGFKAAFADRARVYGDPDFVRVPLLRLLSADHAAKIRRRISAVEVVPPAVYGNAAPVSDAGTAHISVVDAFGNAAACTTSVNTPFGALLAVPKHDIVLNNTMDDFSVRPGVANTYGLVGSEANAIAAGKRPLSSMAPTIVLQDGRVRLVAGASGGPLIITGTLQAMVNVLEFSMDAGRAVAAPRVHNQWMPDRLAVEKGIPESVRSSLERRGHNVVQIGRSAAVQLVELVSDSQGRLVRAASDARKGGQAAAF